MGALEGRLLSFFGPKQSPLLALFLLTRHCEFDHSQRWDARGWI